MITFSSTFDYSVANQTKVTFPNGNVTLLEYQNNAALVRRTDSYGSSPTIQARLTATAPTCWVITAINDANVGTTTQTWDSNGNLLTSRGPLGRKTTNT